MLKDLERVTRDLDGKTVVGELDGYQVIVESRLFPDARGFQLTIEKSAELIESSICLTPGEAWKIIQYVVEHGHSTLRLKWRRLGLSEKTIKRMLDEWGEEY